MNNSYEPCFYRINFDVIPSCVELPCLFLYLCEKAFFYFAEKIPQHGNIFCVRVYYGILASHRVETHILKIPHIFIGTSYSLGHGTSQ